MQTNHCLLSDVLTTCDIYIPESRQNNKVTFLGKTLTSGNSAASRLAKNVNKMYNDENCQCFMVVNFTKFYLYLLVASPQSNQAGFQFSAFEHL